MSNPVFSAAPVAVDDTYVVDVGGTVSVRSSYSTTMTAKTPSLFWNLNDVSVSGIAPSIPHTIDSGSDSVDGTGFLYSTSASINLSNAPLLAPAGGFKGFASSNVWWELGDADSGVGGNGGFIQNVVNPKTAWGSEVGSISMWFRIPADKTGLNDPTTFGKSVIFAGVNTSDYGSLPYSVYKTSVVIFYSESKLSFNLYQDGTTLASFTTSSTFNDNAWHHLVASWDNATGNVAAFHIDGGSLAGAAKSYTGQSYYDLTTDFTFDVRLQVGQGEFSQTAFNGFIDELAIWTEDALTAADARDLYFAGIGGPLSNDSDAESDAITWLEADMNKAGLGSYVSNLTIQDTGGGFDFDGTGVAAGNYSFTYKATAGGEKSGDAIITIKVNGPPTGGDDSGYVTAPGNVLNVNAATGVLANDSDPNNDTLSAFIASNPADGTLTLNADGSFTYDATSASAATKTFTYKVSDGSLEAGPYTATIIVSSNDPPVITQGDSVAVTMSEEGSPTAWSTPTIVSTDGDSTPASQHTWSLLSAASNGTANVSGTAASPTITYSPSTDFNGTDSFVVKVADETTLSDTITVNVTVSNVNDAPVISTGNAKTINENQTYALDVNATDIDSSSSSFDWSLAGGADQAKFTIDASTGVLSFSSSPDYENPTDVGPDNVYEVQVTVSDGSDSSSPQMISITISDVVEAQPPVITQGTSLSTKTGNEDTTFTWTAAELNATDADTSSGSLTWSVDTNATNGVATVSGTGSSPATFSYVPDGNYSGGDSFVVQVSDGALADTLTVTVTVAAVNDTPVFTSTAVTSVRAGDSYVYNVRADDSDGNSTLELNSTITPSPSPSWLAFTDQGSGAGLLSGTPVGANIGSHNVSLRAMDDNGTYADQNFTIVVLPANYSPVIKVDNIDVNSTSVTMVEDNASTFSLSGLTASDFNDPNATLVWSVDTNATNGTAVVEGTGTEPSTVTFTPNPDFNGTDSFVLKVTDAQGAVDTLTVYLTVTNVNDGPLINDGNATIALSVTEENATTLSAGLLVATDVDTIGSGLIWSVLSGPSNGAAVVFGTGNSPVTFTYTSAVDFNGTDSFVARVSDGLLDDNITVNVTVSNVNDRPVINDGNATVSLTVIEDTATSFTLTSLIAIDVDTASGLLVWNLDSNASHGVASVSGSGASPLTFSFLPDANFTGLDSFDVRVSDGVIDDLIRVDLNVTNVNDPPHFTSVPVAQANQLVPYLYTVTAADADGNATPLTLTAALKPNWPTTTFVDNGDGTGVLSGTPLEGHLGDHNVTLVVSDGNLSTSQSFIITVEDINAPPVITQGQELNATVMEDNASTWTETLAASDVDDDDATLVWTLDSNATYGVATVSGTGPSPTTFTYVPNLDYNGSDSFVVRVSDWKSSDLITVNIDVLWVDDPPVITQGMDVNGTVAERREANATIAWLVQPDLNATDIDHNASFLTWSLLTPPTNGEAEVNGTGAAPTTFTYSPNVLFDGTDSFVVQVSDGNLTDTATVTVIVPGVNDPPVIVQGTSVTATMDEGGYPTPWQAPLLTATDPEGDLLTWSAYYVNASEGNGTLTVSGMGSSPSVFSYSPNLDFNGTDAFQVRVADGNADGNDTDEVTVTVTVTGNEEDTTAVYSLTAPVTYTIDRNASLDFLVTGGAHLASPSPRLTLFTDNVYVFDVNSTSGGPLFLGTSPGIPYVGGEVWGNGASWVDGYLVFRPTSVTPPLLYYYDGNDSNNIFAPIEVRQYQSSDIFANDPLSDNAFGGAVSLLGDRAILGATGVSDDTGAVYVFDRDANGAFVQSTKVTPTDLNTFSLFGGSVALGNDFLVAGAPNDRDFNGSVYVYNLEANGSWMQSQKLLLTTPVTAIDAFGKAVAVSGDALVVTATQPNEGNGSAYVFRRDLDGNWSQEAMLSASDGAVLDQFGYSVALDGNLTVVGVNKADANGLDSGAAYVFNYEVNGSWSQEQKLSPSVHTTGDEFGTSVAVFGSVALVGAIKADGNGTDSGAAYVFRRDADGNWTQEALLAPPVEGIVGFGSSVALSGNYALVDSRIVGTGGASYLYRNEANTTSWTFTSMLGRTQGVSLGTQGTTVAMSGDMILAGSPGDDRNGSDAGAATLFTNPGWGAFTYPMLAPIITQGTNLSVSMNEDGAWTVPELNASDPFGDILVWSLDSNATNGLASVSGTGNSPPTFGYVSEGNYSGTDSFVVQVSDGLMSDFITVDVNITAQPDAPVFTSTPVENAVEGSLYTYNVVAKDDDAGATLAITAVGTLPAWMTGVGLGITDNGNGSATLSGQPVVPQNGTYQVTLRVTDDTNRSAEQNFSIVVAPINFPPTIRIDGVDASETTATVNEDDNNSFVMSSIISVNDDTLPFGDLSWSVDANETNGTVSVTGDAFTPTVTYTPFPDFNGLDSFSMVVSDAEFNDTITVYVTVQAVNDRPIFTSSPPATDVNESTTFTYSVQVSDVDGDAISIDATGLPSWLAFNDSGDGTATLSGTPAWYDFAESSVFLFATDSSGSGAVQDFVVSVIPDNYPPVITQGDELSPVASMDEDGSPFAWSLTSLTATDRDPEDVSRLVWSIKQEPANGTAVVEGTGASPSTFTYAPFDNFNGQDSFVVSVHDVDDSNASDEIIVPVTVNPQDDPPVFTSTAPAFGLMGNNYTYTVQASDPDGLFGIVFSALSKPDWMNLDQDPTLSGGNATLSGKPLTADNNVTVTLQVKDPTGLFDTQTFSINVIGENAPPIVAQGTELSPVIMDEDGSPTAWQPPVLTATDADGHPLHWSLSETPEHGIAEVNGTGSSPSTFGYIPDGNYSGTDSFVVQVTDSIAAVKVTVQVTIDPQPDAPVFVSTPELLVEDGEEYTYELNATDEDGDVDLTFFVPSSLPLPAWLSLVEKNGKSILTGVPSVGDEGSNSVQVAVKDDSNLSTVQAFDLEVEVKNYPPSITVNGLEDQNSTAVTIDEDGNESIWVALGLELNATDDQTNALVWSISSSPLHGNATISGIGNAPDSLVYVPEANFNGRDQFTVRVTDQKGDSNSEKFDEITVVVTVRAVADAPSFLSTSTPITTITDELDYLYEVSTTDPDGNDTLTLSYNGTLPSWLTFSDEGNGTAILRGRAAVGDEKTSAGNPYSISLVVTDDSDLSVDQNFTITVTIDNYPPVFPDAPFSVTMSEDGSPTAWKFPLVTAVDPDPEVSDAPELTWSLGAQAAHGIAEVNGTGTTLDGKNDTFSYVPDENYFGTDSFIVRVSDGHRFADANVSVTVSPRPDPPAFVSVPTTYARAGQEFRYDVSVLDPDGGDLSLRVFGLPKDWMNLDDSNSSVGHASIFGTPSGNIVGKFYPISLVAIDSTGRLAFQSFTLEVGPGNVPPVIVQGEQLYGSIVEDNASSWSPPDLNASNSDGDTLVWNLAPDQGPSHGTATIEGNGSRPTTFDYVADANYSGTDSFVIRVWDGYAELNATVNVTVYPVNDTPELSGTPVTAAVEGKLYSFDLNATDIDGDALTFSFTESPSWLAFQDLGGGLVQISGIPPIGSRGESNVTFTAMDDGNATAEISFGLTVLDGLPPVITLLGDSLLQLPVGEAFIEPGYVGSDDSDGDITDSVVVSSAVDSSIPGTYVITYSLSDKAGNDAAPLTRVVHVSDPSESPKALRATSASVNAEINNIALGSGDSVYSVGSFTDSLQFGQTTIHSQGLTDIFLSRLSSDGSPLWVIGFGGLDSDNGTDVVIGLDDSAYVTGSFRGAISFGEHSLISEGGSDAFLVKVDSQGSVLWAKTLGGPGDDNGLALSVSADGSVLWTGFHSSNSFADSTALEDFGGLDTFLAKVGVDGSYSWVRSVGGPGDDSGEGVAVDPAGGSYLVGNVSNQSPSDVFLLRYNDDGELVWARKAGGASSDTATAIVADSSGVYVTGNFEETATFEDVSITSAGLSDVYLAKYSPSGSLTWAKSFGGVGTDDSDRIDLDPFGNLCLLGSFEGSMSFDGQVLVSKGSRDLFLAKTAATSGKLIWSRSIGGETLDSAHGLSSGSEGSLYLASHYIGNSLTIDSLAASTTGTHGFSILKLGAPHGLPTSSLPEIGTLVTGQSFGFDMNATSNSGILPRFQFISGPSWLNLQDRGNGSALLAGIPPAGSSGSYNAKIRITDMQGGTVDKSLEFDVFKSLSEPTGFADEPETLWLQPGQGGEFANGVAASGDGGFFVVGAFTGSTQIGGVILAAKGQTDSFVAKFNSAGTLEWVNRFGGLEQDYAYAVDVDLNGVAYVAGYFTGTATFGSHVLTSSGGHDIYFLRIEPDGQVTWALSFGGSFDDYGKAVHAVPNGSVYLAGHFSDFAIFGNSFLNSNGGEDGFVAKINGSNGSLEWVKNMGGQNSDRALDLTEDGNNGVAVAGRFESVATFGDHSVTSLGFGDAFLARYDASGSCLFAVRAGGTGEDEGRAVVRSSTGSYLFGGNFRNSSTFGGHAIVSRGGSDAFLAWVSPYGAFSSVTSLGGVWSDEVVDLALDVSGKPIVAGSFRGSVEFGSNTFSSRGDSDAFIAKLSDTNSSVMWVKTGGGLGADAARAVAVDSLFDRICLAGYVSPDATFDNLAASGDTTRRSLLIADLGYPSVDDTRFRSYPLRFATGGALYRYDFESGPWGISVPTVSAIQLPPWLSLQDHGDGNGSISGVVPSDANGTYSITLVAKDESDREISQTFSLVVGSSNGSPVIIASPSTRAVPLEEYSFDLNVFDPEGDVVLIYATNLPSWLKLEPHGNGTATVSGVPTNASGAVEEIEIIVTDGKHETRLSFSIEIASSWWGTSEHLGAGQWRRNWFGTFSLSMFSWIYHEHLGWVFAEGTQPDSVWFWIEGWGWFWTSSQHWNSDTGQGHVYSSEDATWLYLRSYGSPKNAKLYRYSTEKWMPLLLEGH